MRAGQLGKKKSFANIQDVAFLLDERYVGITS